MSAPSTSAMRSSIGDPKKEHFPSTPPRKKKKKKQAFAAKIKTMFGEKSVAKQSPRNKFRAMIRYVAYNSEWLFDIDITKTTEDDHPITLRTDKLFTLREKYILVRPVEMRTEEEIEMIYKKMSSIKSIRKYPESVQRDLARVLEFKYFKKGSIILKEGQPVKNVGCMYYVIKGHVDLVKKKKDEDKMKVYERMKMYNMKIDDKIGEKKDGDELGSVGLLFNINRSSTAVAATNVELLALKFADFERVLKESLWIHWNEIMEAINSLYYFDDWTKENKTYCCGLAEMKMFKKNDIIIESSSNQPSPVMSRASSSSSLAYFILKGKCQIVGTIVVKKRPAANGKHATYSLCDKQEIKFTTLSTETIFLKLCTLSVGQVFEIGENMTSRRIMASETTKCLILPIQYLLRTDTTRFWGRVKKFMDDFIPSVERQFQWFVNSIRVKEAKKKYLQQFKRSDITARIVDVPVTARAQVPVRIELLRFLPPQIQAVYLKVEALTYDMGKLHYPFVMEKKRMPRKRGSLSFMTPRRTRIFSTR